MRNHAARRDENRIARPRSQVAFDEVKRGETLDTEKDDVRPADPAMEPRTMPHTREQIGRKYFISPRMSPEEMNAAIDAMLAETE